MATGRQPATPHAHSAHIDTEGAIRDRKGQHPAAEHKQREDSSMTQAKRPTMTLEQWRRAHPPITNKDGLSWLRTVKPRAEAEDEQ
jgi:hypothetical protein